MGNMLILPTILDVLRYLFVILHLIGMAIIVGGYFANLRSARVIPGMLHASFLQLITGLVLVGIAEAGPAEVNHMKIGIKLVVAILVTVFAFIGNKKQKKHAATNGSAEGPQPSATMAHLTFAFATLNVIIAVTM